jgi:hypothetical protein
VPTEAVTAVTEPITVKADGIYNIKTELKAEEKPDNNLAVSITYDYSNPFGATGQGMILYSTIFAYNYDDVQPEFSPKTKAEVEAAGIPYKSTSTTIYPNNKNIKAGADLPSESIQGGLNLAKPYNYGVIITKTDL